MKRRQAHRPSTFERRKILAIVAKHEAMTIEQIALARSRGISSTAQHVRILADLGYLDESEFTYRPDPMRPGRVLRFARTYTVTDAGRALLAKFSRPDRARIEAREDVRDTLATLGAATLAEIAADTGRDHEQIKTALDDLGAREEIGSRAWRLA